MIGWWRTPEVSDPYFGRLTYTRGMWRGHIAALGSGAVPLAICGSRRAPDAAALSMARGLCAKYAAWRFVLGQQLLGHLRPYVEAVAACAMPAPAEPLPDIQRPGDVWPYVAIEFVVVAPVRGRLTFEVGYCVMWDEGLILGARFQEGRFVELTGRVPRAVAAWCRRRDRYSGATRTLAFAMPARHNLPRWND